MTMTTDLDLTVRVPVLLADAQAAVREMYADMDPGMLLAVDGFLGMGFADDQTSMPTDEAHFRARTAESWVSRAALCITVGTSGGVPVAVRLASIAHKAGALLVDVNPYDNALRQLAADTGGVVVEVAATTGVPAVAAIIEEALR